MKKVKVCITAKEEKPKHIRLLAEVGRHGKGIVQVYEVWSLQDLRKWIDKEAKKSKAWSFGHQEQEDDSELLYYDNDTIQEFENQYSDLKEAMGKYDYVLGQSAADIPEKDLKELRIANVFNMINGRMFCKKIKVYSCKGKNYIHEDDLEQLFVG